METRQLTSEPKRAPRQPPRWVVRSIWMIHRGLYSITGGRFGLRTATPERWGTMRLKTTGRRSGVERIAILGFIEDGANLVTPAMNGWADAEPAWWLNLQANPDAIIELPDGSTHRVRARKVGDDERPRLWKMFLALNSSAYTDASAARRSRDTALVILEPQLDGA